MKILVLAGHHVRELMPYRECADVMREALAELARGQIQQPLRTVVRLRDAAGFMGLMPGLLSWRRLRAEGHLRHAGQPGHRQGRASGRRAAVRRAHRGAAGAGQRVGGHRDQDRGHLRRRNRPAGRAASAELAIIGTGVQGQAHAHAIAATRPLTGIRLAGRDLARTREVAAELTGQLGLPVTSHDAVADAVAGAGIVVTATTSPLPVLRREWLSPGTHVNAVGACLPADREIDTAIMAEAAIFADSRESVSHEAGDFLLAAREGAVNPVRAELGELLTGTAPGRASDDEITVFESLGLAAEDLAAASYLYEKATRLGAGTPADF